MSLKKVNQVRADRGFKIWDIAVYAAILAAVAALFVVMFFTRDESQLKGIYVYYDNVVIYVYDFGEMRGEIRDGAHIAVLDEDDESLKLRFHVGSSLGSDYNDILIDKAAVSVTITDADCSARKDCYYMDDIVNAGGALICTPHRLKIIPYGYEEDGGGIVVG